MSVSTNEWTSVSTETWEQQGKTTHRVKVCLKYFLQDKLESNHSLKEYTLSFARNNVTEHEHNPTKFRYTLVT